ncbi:MAG: hypothetical protein V1656_02625 [Candidatus Jorgensenbacteria bacterium]
MTLITSRDPKGLQFVNLCEAVYNKAHLDNNRAQLLNERGGELQDGLKKIIEELTVNRYADEEVKSNYSYLSGYKPKGITEQTNVLRQLFPGIGYANEKIASQSVPEGAEGWFAIPKWQSIAPTYSEAVQKVLDLIKKTRDGKFYNYREGQLGPKNLRQSEKSANRFQKFSDEQKDYNILVVAAQFGILHRGRSVRRAREVMNADQFGFGAFAIGIMLLTHPERLQSYNDLWIDCAGDEFSLGAGDGFSEAPCFGFGGVGFDTRSVGSARGDCGSVSGFVG